MDLFTSQPSSGFEPLNLFGICSGIYRNVFWNLLLNSFKFAPAMIEGRERTRSLLLLPPAPKGGLNGRT